MKKLAIVGIVLSGILLPLATAQAKPVEMTKTEYRALKIRRDGLNQKYGVGQPIIRQKLGEIGAWAVPSTGRQRPPARDSQQAIIRQKLGEIGAWAVPSTSSTTVASSSGGFDWNDAGIGAGFATAALLLGAAGLVTRRRHHRRPLPH